MIEQRISHRFNRGHDSAGHRHVLIDKGYAAVLGARLHGRASGVPQIRLRTFNDLVQRVREGPLLPDSIHDVVRRRRPKNSRQPISIPVAVGELIDKISILEIKRDRIGDSTGLLSI